MVEVKPPFNPTSAVADMAATLKSYQLGSTVGDKYAAGWVVDAFAKVGVTYMSTPSATAQAYLDALPRLHLRPRSPARQSATCLAVRGVGKTFDAGRPRQGRPWSGRPGRLLQRGGAGAFGAGERLRSHHELGPGRRAAALSASVFRSTGRPGTAPMMRRFASRPVRPWRPFGRRQCLPFSVGVALLEILPRKSLRRCHRED